jgi:outer membrane protein assembly factor BamC
MHPVTRSPAHLSLLGATTLAAVLTLAGCSTITDALSGDKLDYRSAGNKTSGLEVPPDLTQLSPDSRYEQSDGTVSAAAFRANAPAAAASGSPRVAPANATVAARRVGNVDLERLGNDRWLHTTQTPEQLWPQLRAFWADQGFTIVEDRPTAGTMETNWAENHAKLPQDFIRRTLGKIVDNAYSTGELDKFRTRVERAKDGGTDIYITHRGMVETYVGAMKDSTTWQPRPADPQLEGDFLSLLMVKLGANEETAKAAVAASAPNQPSAAAAPAHARIVAGRAAATLEVDDGFDRAWRRVGVALDRSGFTVEDRDRSAGVYWVRYVDPALAGKEEPGFFSRLFGLGKKDPALGPVRYRVQVKGEGERSMVSVHDDQGGPENGEAGQRITKMLLEDLK